MLCSVIQTAVFCAHTQTISMIPAIWTTNRRYSFGLHTAWLTVLDSRHCTVIHTVLQTYLRTELYFTLYFTLHCTEQCTANVLNIFLQTVAHTVNHLLQCPIHCPQQNTIHHSAMNYEFVHSVLTTYSCTLHYQTHDVDL